MQNFSRQVIVSAGQTTVIVLPKFIANQCSTVAVHPSAGGAALVEFSLSPIDDIVAESATVKWVPWSNGTVTESTANDAQSPINAYRCTATAADCVLEVLAL